MSTAPEAPTSLHFACTLCGACCNRSPEVLLSEAAALADIFVFRLMFRLYVLPDVRSGQAEPASAGSAEAFYESKRLLNAFAARKSSTRIGKGANAAGHSKYLLISALSLDTGSGACAALSGNRCGIYERRPLACRSVPFHYSRPEASAASDLAAFAARPGHRCDTSPEAPIVFERGRIVDPEVRRARADALEASALERNWQDAIVRRLKACPADHGLPSLAEIEANAPFGVTTVSMRAAWHVAAEAGLIGARELATLAAAQTKLIDRALASPDCPLDARETLIDMRAESLNGNSRSPMASGKASAESGIWRRSP